jgi:acyl carrier protein
MGLDAVELVLEIEEAFSIKIPDDEATRLVTVGDIHKFIVDNADVGIAPKVCLSAAAFYALRGAARSLGVTRRLRPRDSTATLLPESNRRHFWQSLQATANLKFPNLRRPPWLVRLSICAVTMLAVWIGFLTWRSMAVEIAAVMAVITSAAVAGAVLAWVTAPFAVYPASNFKTLRGLAESILGLNFKALAERNDGARTADVWVALRSIIVEQLGVSPDVVTPTASFVRDLGCD